MNKIKLRPLKMLEKVIEKWNNYSEVYAKEAEPGTFQSGMILQNLASCGKADRVLDAGCGPGLVSHTLASSIMKPGAVLYSVDVAEKMLDVMEKRFEGMCTRLK